MFLRSELYIFVIYYIMITYLYILYIIVFILFVIYKYVNIIFVFGINIAYCLWQLLLMVNEQQQGGTS